MKKKGVAGKAQKRRRRNREKPVKTAMSKLFRKLGIEDMIEPELSVEQLRRRAIKRAKKARQKGES